ncbi:MAG: hypothetical protein HY817_05410 [Candidatus Abawacabacteria bacterium]|nr:hypothetical protein [Candidatus Abawacabacteria bacterium]
MNFLDRLFFQKFLEDGEEIVYVIHKHWWAVAQALIKLVALALVFPGMILWLYWHPMLAPILAIWVIYIVILFLQDFIDWFYDALLVSKSCVINIDWHGFFHSQAKRLNFENMEGVSYEIKGIIPTFFQFGDLKVTGANTELVLSMVPKVREWQKMVLAAKEEVAPKSEDAKQEQIDQLKSALQNLLAVTPESDPVSFNVKAHQVMVMKQKDIKKKK